ncbi:MAG: hypothetical protein GQ477_04390 [Nanohaloarchaea archaeon]|nr:hypothetical protein [Candidatus Nanohaloarchaea archaeon]
MGMKFELFGNLKKKQNHGVPDAQHNPMSSDAGMPPMSDNLSAPLPQAMPQQDNFTQPMPSNPPMSQFQSASSAPANIMADVNNLTSQGMPEAEMVKELKAKGYNFKEIDNALGNAIRSQVSGDNLSAITPGMAAEQPQPNNVLPQDQPSDFSQQMMSQTDVTRNDNLEAMIESIVEERLTTFKTSIDNIDASITDIRSEIENLDISLKSVESKTDGTVSDIKKDMELLRDDFSTVSPKVSSIERAFKDVVPNLVEAISQVNDKLHIHSEKINTDSIDLNMATNTDLNDISDTEPRDEKEQKFHTTKSISEDDKDIEKDTF